MNNLKTTIKKNDLPSGWRVVELGGVTKLTNVKFDLKDISLNKYISTDTMLKNLGGIERAKKIPLIGKVKKFQEGDVLFSNIRTYFRKVWYATLDGGCSNDVLVFRSTKGIYSKYMYYLLADNTFIDYTDKTSKGTKMPRGDKDAILKYPVYIPPLSEQKAIAHILGKLDDKIALNRQINQTLETMAQTLFKSWFVNFDPVIDNALKAGNPIPDSLKTQAEKRKTTQSTLSKTTQNLFPNRFVFNNKLKKWIPEGWEVTTIEEISTVIGGGTPSTKIEGYYCKNGIAWLSPKDLSNYGWKYIEKGKTDITELGLQKSSAKLMPKGTILFSSRAPIGYIAIAENEICTNQGFKSLVPNKNIPTEYLFQFLRFNTEQIKNIATGSTFAEISSTMLKNILIIKPPVKILGHLKLKVKSMNNQSLLNQKQTQTLTKLRDTLLPKLISGKIRIFAKD